MVTLFPPFPLSANAVTPAPTAPPIRAATAATPNHWRRRGRGGGASGMGRGGAEAEAVWEAEAEAGAGAEAVSTTAARGILWEPSP